MPQLRTAICCFTLFLCLSTCWGQKGFQMDIIKEEIVYYSWNTATEITRIDGKITGPLFTYDGDHRLIAQRVWKDNRPVGMLKTFHKNGKVHWMVNMSEKVYDVPNLAFNILEGPPYGFRGITGLDKESGIPEGIAKAQDENGRQIYKAEFKNGQKNGIYEIGGILTERTHGHVRPKEEGFYKDDLKTGKWVYRNKRGYIYLREEYRAGILHGESSEYNDHGGLILTHTWNNGVLDGITTYARNSEGLKTQIPYVNGIRSGTQRTFHRWGEGVASTAQWVNDEKTGPYKKFHKAGFLAEWGWYKKGIKDSLWRTWNHEGELTYSGSYSDGKKVGQHLEWNDNSKLRAWETYANDQLQGTATYWYDSGKPSHELTYEDGVRQGNFKTWRDEGGLYLTGTYKNDEPHGLWTYYSREGQKARQVVYENGKEIRSTDFLKNWIEFIDEVPYPDEQEVMIAPEEELEPEHFYIYDDAHIPPGDIVPVCSNADKVLSKAPGILKRRFRKGFTAKVILERSGAVKSVESVSAVTPKEEQALFKTLAKMEWTPCFVGGSERDATLWIRIHK